MANEPVILNVYDMVRNPQRALTQFKVRCFIEAELQCWAMFTLNGEVVQIGYFLTVHITNSKLDSSVSISWL